MTEAPSTADWRSLALRQFRRARVEAGRLLAGVDRAGLDERPPAGPDSVGWLVWHLSRGLDRNASEMAGRTQAWVADGWADLFGRPADPADTGFGHSPQDARAFRSPEPAVLLGYHAAAHDVVVGLLTAAPLSDLDRTVASPTLGNVHTVEERLAALLHDTVMHLGQLSAGEPPARRAGSPP